MAPPLSQRERFFDLFGARNHGGHDERGAQGEDGPSRLHFDPAYDQVLFDRRVAIVKGVALVHSFGKQFRVLAQHLSQVLPILCRVVHIRSILGFTWKR